MWDERRTKKFCGTYHIIMVDIIRKMYERNQKIMQQSFYRRKISNQSNYGLQNNNNTYI